MSDASFEAVDDVASCFCVFDVFCCSLFFLEVLDDFDDVVVFWYIHADEFCVPSSYFCKFFDESFEVSSCCCHLDRHLEGSLVDGCCLADCFEVVKRVSEQVYGFLVKVQGDGCGKAFAARCFFFSHAADDVIECTAYFFGVLADEFFVFFGVR